MEEMEQGDKGAAEGKASTERAQSVGDVTAGLHEHRAAAVCPQLCLT